MVKSMIMVKLLCNGLFLIVCKWLRVNDASIHNGDFQPFINGIPSGKCLHSYVKIHHATSGKTHCSDWAAFNSYVYLPGGICLDR